MKKIAQTFVITTIFLMSPISFAQFGGLGGLKDAIGGGDSNEGGNALELQLELIAGLGIASYSFTKATEKFADALQLDALAREAKELGKKDPSKDESVIGIHLDFNNEALEQVNAKIAEGAELSAEGKKDFAEGLLPYAAGMAAMVKMAKIAPEFLKAAADEIKSIKNPMQIIKVKKQFDLGMKTGKKVPPTFKMLGDTTKTVFTFAKKNGISTGAQEKQMKGAGVTTDF